MWTKKNDSCVKWFCGVATTRMPCTSERSPDTDEPSTSNVLNICNNRKIDALMWTIARRFLYKRPGHKLEKLFSTKKIYEGERRRRPISYVECCTCVQHHVSPKFNDWTFEKFFRLFFFFAFHLRAVSWVAIDEREIIVYVYIKCAALCVMYSRQ